DPTRGRVVAVDPDQGHLPAPLPFANWLSPPELAAGPRRRIPDGAGTRQFLPGLLLVLDVPAVFWRHHEPVLDHLLGHLCAGPEIGADGFVDRADCRRRRHCLGPTAAGHNDPHGGTQRLSL